MNKINVITLCSGYGSQEMALKRLKRAYPDFDFDIIAWSEIDDNAIKAYKACHPEFVKRNVGDMTKTNWGGKTYQMWTCFFIAHHASLFRLRVKAKE